MSISKNQLLGHWVCDLGGQAEVYQTKKKGDHFYTRCQCCGLVQGTGAQRQQKIYSEAKFISGVTVRVPANVDANAAKAAPVNEPEPEQEQAKPAVSDFDPSEKPSEEQSEVTETEPGVNRLGVAAKALPLLVLGIAAGVGAWMN